MSETSPLAVEVEEPEVDVACAHAVATRIRTAMIDAGCYDVVIDLGAVGFIDSTGLGGLVEVGAFANDHGGTASLLHVQAQPARALQLTGLSAVLPIITDNPR